MHAPRRPTDRAAARRAAWAALSMSGGTAPGILVWMPINSGAACAPIKLVISPPQSPPCAVNFAYPRRFISTTQARAMRSGPQPAAVGLPEKP